MKMKSIFTLIVLLLSICFAEAQSPSCIGHIITKIEELGTDKISIKEINDIAKDHEFIKGGFIGNAAKEQATARMFEFLSEFITLAPDISAEGMKGYTRFAGGIVRADGTDFLEDLVKVFGGRQNFDGSGFNKVMSYLGQNGTWLSQTRWQSKAGVLFFDTGSRE